MKLSENDPEKVVFITFTAEYKKNDLLWLLYEYYMQNLKIKNSINK